MDVVQFRQDFPEFASTSSYPNAQVEFWAGVAEAQLRECVWGDTRPFAVELYVAHEITVAYQNAKVSASGGAPGVFSGGAQSKAVGGVNVTYDTQAISEKDAGHWNLTTYGKQLYRLMKMFGAGAIQL